MSSVHWRSTCTPGRTERFPIHSWDLPALLHELTEIDSAMRAGHFDVTHFEALSRDGLGQNDSIVLLGHFERSTPAGYGHDGHVSRRIHVACAVPHHVIRPTLR